jgi:arylsulfatase A-like enzyme
MTELDDNIGVILQKIQDFGIADNTIVIFSSDNGAVSGRRVEPASDIPAKSPLARE